MALKQKLRPGMSSQNGMNFPNGAAFGNCVPDSTPRMGFIFQQRHGAESASRNPSISVVKWLSERRAEDARRKNNIESGVKTTLKVA